MEQESNVESAYRAQTRKSHGQWPGVASGGMPSQPLSRKNVGTNSPRLQLPFLT